MTWNHRVFVDRTGEKPVYSVREASYEDGVLKAFSAVPVAPQEATLDGLRLTLRRMLVALSLPVIEEQNAIGSPASPPTPAPSPLGVGESFWERDDAIRARVKAELASRAAIRKDRNG